MRVCGVRMHPLRSQKAPPDGIVKDLKIKDLNDSKQRGDGRIDNFSVFPAV